MTPHKTPHARHCVAAMYAAVRERKFSILNSLFNGLTTFYSIRGFPRHHKHENKHCNSIIFIFLCTEINFSSLKFRRGEAGVIYKRRESLNLIIVRIHEVDLIFSCYTDCCRINTSHENIHTVQILNYAQNGNSKITKVFLVPVRKIFLKFCLLKNC